jgi:copper homeostasis protein
VSRIALEIACGSIHDAVIADQAGADRLELCAAMELGGLTPSLGTVFEVSERVDAPFVTMIRPRAGSYQWTGAELAGMERDASLMMETGASGIVFGCLTSSGAVDVRACKRLMRAAGRGETVFHPVEAVFHRAFDESSDQLRALETLIEMGITRVLTSGGAATALEGVARIRTLVERAAGRIEILPAGGIREENVEAVVKQTGCQQVHLSRR